MLFLLPAEACFPGKAGLLALVTVWKADPHRSVPRCFWVLRRSRNLSLSPQICPQFPWSAWSTESTDLQLGKGALMGGHGAFQWL